MMKRLILTLAVILFSASLRAAILEGMRIDETASSASIYMMFSGQTTPRIFSLDKPNRLVIDFNQTRTTMRMSDVSMSHQCIRSLRSGAPNPQSLRLVFELNSPMKYSLSKWQAPVNGREGLRIDLSMLSKRSESHASLPLGVTRAPSAALVAKPTRAAIAVARPSARARDVVVVIDAGHGGKDPGAAGPSRYAEKNVTLAIALKLKQVIDAQAGMRAVLTRRGDYYIALRERLNIARKARGDIFISIHADAFKNRESHGASVFALSSRGATSEAARWLAAKENHSELGGVNLRDLDDQNGLVRSVLIDLSQTATINASVSMGTQMLQELGRFTHLHNHHVEQAGFLVLKSPDIPSVLIETGFISNPQEERNLSSAAYQGRLAQAIVQGLKRYFTDNPPHGSRFEVEAYRRS